mmetsp:Transcript_9271/g.17741  ORF Transcript_9271/g.17741 Transcript_9271/m.17741 type:complete len:321 (+) Transcript_9271:299-1261(+)|eukprot:CAMPEP_0204897218 /NCGR_PEP_ID=MMETSP1397-20131031/613_1 /ASSEMBLY_ACC=CAM_ASM_000891 /TAXON_ID=49980 /ORGANISM="Climacostomum Climacostomum virens, Strain Stock W-24" /LENGTH=320 /DNA_ID=CAMNT_0052064939 /DNA_START=252 /DNA_END=1214 /DNA_ORIENTATION=+
MNITNFDLNQIVWAKISGHPWWPAYIVSIDSTEPSDQSSCDEFQITVNFIGENSHAVLSPTQVTDFLENYSLHNKTKKRKLKDSIDLAYSVAQGDQPFSIISRINNKRKDSATSDTAETHNLNSEFKAKLLALEAQIERSPPTVSKTDKAGTDSLRKALEKHQSTIHNVISSSADGIDLERLNGLVDCLQELTSLRYPPEVLQSARIGNLISKIHDLFGRAKSSNLRKLSRVAEKIVTKLTTSASSVSYIPNLCLRNRVCQKIALSLQSIGFGKDKSQELALCLEAKLRKKDPSMGKTYKHYFNCMHKDISGQSAQSNET